MYTTKIHLSNIDEVKKFVSFVSSFPFEVNLCTDKYKIDAKSIMGVFSLDLSEPITVEVDKCNEEEKTSNKITSGFIASAGKKAFCTEDQRFRANWNRIVRT